MCTRISHDDSDLLHVIEGKGTYDTRLLVLDGRWKRCGHTSLVFLRRLPVGHQMQETAVFRQQPVRFGHHFVSDFRAFAQRAPRLEFCSSDRERYAYCTSTQMM